MNVCVFVCVRGILLLLRKRLRGMWKNEMAQIHSAEIESFNSNTCVHMKRWRWVDTHNTR